MVVNDDLKFPQGSLERAVSLLPCSDVLAPSIEGESGRVSFDATKGRFLEHNSYGPSNLAITMATFLRRSTWLQEKPIPKRIPHYLSGHWFTHSLSCKDLKIITVPEFSVFCRQDTTRFSGPSSTSFQARLAYWRSCLDPRSPDYIPASIVFRNWFSKERYKFFSLFILRLKILVYSALTGYRPGKIADLQS
jgi:hypothetical protein